MKPDYIVAIGGSAGFLKPLIKFFDGTPKDNVSYVVLRHVAPDAISHLSEILKRHSALKIRQVENHVEPEGNNVYILPPGYYATLAGGKFNLIERCGYPNCAIDVFMNSLAREYPGRAMAIILSGSGRDGSEGVANIKKTGGLVLVQQPGSCEFAYMPEYAIKTGCVDRILLPEEMPAAVIQHGQQMLINA